MFHYSKESVRKLGHTIDESDELHPQHLANKLHVTPVHGKVKPDMLIHSRL